MDREHSQQALADPEALVSASLALPDRPPLSNLPPRLGVPSLPAWPCPLQNHALWLCPSLLPREHRGDPIPKVAFHLLKLVGLVGCQGPGGKERGATCSGTGLGDSLGREGLLWRAGEADTTDEQKCLDREPFRLLPTARLLGIIPGPRMAGSSNAKMFVSVRQQRDNRLSPSLGQIILVAVSVPVLSLLLWHLLRVLREYI